MLKIAICDDEQRQLDLLDRLVKEYEKEKKLDAKVSVFLHPDQLLCACEKESFHIYILDIVMPMVDGVELGIEIRHINHEAQIIYCTTEQSFALDAYAANPVNYLLKPIDRATFFKTLDLAAERVDFGEEGRLIVKTREGIITISFDKILCCEYKNHKVIYKLTDMCIETTSSSESFAEHIAPLLKDKRFISPHSSFLVNMYYAIKVIIRLPSLLQIKHPTLQLPR